MNYKHLILIMCTLAHTNNVLSFSFRSFWNKCYEYVYSKYAPYTVYKEYVVKPKITFNDIIGQEELKNKLTTDCITPFTAQSLTNQEEHHTLIIGLEGQTGSGKTFLSEAIAGELQKNIPEMHLLKLSIQQAQHIGINGLKNIINICDPLVLVIDDINYHDTHSFYNTQNEEMFNFIHDLLRYTHVPSNKQSIIILTAYIPEEDYDLHLLRESQDEKLYRLTYPTAADREIFLKKQLTKQCISINQNTIDHIVAHTENQYLEKIQGLMSETIKSAGTQVPKDKHFKQALHRFTS